VLSGDELDVFAQNALENYRLVLMSAGGNQRFIVPAAEAMTRTRFVPVDKLDEVNPAEWVVTWFACRNYDPARMRGRLMDTVTREGGTVNPYAGGGVLLAERADRLRNVLKIAREIDAAEATEFRAHTLPEGVNADEAVKALRELFDSDARFAAAPGGKKIIARVRSHQHDQVTEAISSMK
jgi:hypothetical protein